MVNSSSAVTHSLKERFKNHKQKLPKVEIDDEFYFQGLKV